MKKLIPVILCCAMLLAACGSSADSTSAAVSSESSSAAESTIGGADGPTDIVISESTDASTGEEANTANLDAAVAAIEAVNPIANPRALDDFSVENELMLTMDNLVAYKGDVTNDQADCGLVFVAQAKDGQVDAVKSELEAYKASLSANDLYAEFADKIALAKDARIVHSRTGNYNHPNRPKLEDFGDCMIECDNGVTGYFRVDWFTPKGLGAWGDGRTIIEGTDGYIEIRKYIDVANSAEGDQVYYVDHEGEHHCCASGKCGFPFFGGMIRDCLDRTELVMKQDYIFRVIALAMQAEREAEKVGFKGGKRWNKKKSALPLLAQVPLQTYISRPIPSTRSCARCAQCATFSRKKQSSSSSRTA